MRCPFGLIIGNYFFCTIAIDKDDEKKFFKMFNEHPEML